jgi:hypothetical protein
MADYDMPDVGTLGGTMQDSDGESSVTYGGFNSGAQDYANQGIYDYDFNQDFDLASMYDFGSPSSYVYGNAAAPNTTPSEQVYSKIDDTFKRNPGIGIFASLIPGVREAYAAYTGVRNLQKGNVLQGAGLVSAAGAASKGNFGPMAGYATGTITGNPMLAYGASQLANQVRGNTSGTNPTSSSEFNLAPIVEGLVGLYGNRGGGNIDGAAANNAAVSQQIQNLGSMYGPNSPYAQQLRQQLERKDAAAGRRSQYGPREVQLQAALADKAAGVSDSMARLAQSNQANQIALQDRKRLQTGQNLSTLMRMGQQSGVFSGLQNMFRNPTPEVAYDDTTWMGTE